MELPINRLKLMSYKNNIPDLSKKDFNELKKSIEKWGIIEPIIINQHNVIICGKERYRAALILGIDKVPVVIRITNGNAEIRDISLEENLRRRHLASMKNTEEIKTFYSSKGIKKGGKMKRGKSNRKCSRKTASKKLDCNEQQISRSLTSLKLIPELSGLLDKGKINQEAASLYAKVSFENQKKIYDILKDNQ